MKNISLNDKIKWIGTILVLLGALCTSMNLYPYNIYVLNLGALVYLIWSIRIKDNAMIVVNGGLLIIYIIGLII